MAGIWRRYEDQDGRSRIGMSMLTVNADGHPVMPRMHKPNDEKRSVVILRPEDYDEWLHTKNVEAARTMLRLYPAEDMATESASSRELAMVVFASRLKPRGRGQYMFEQLPPINSELVIGFTGIFSRYEYALKNSGFAKGNENKVDPDWDEFSRSIADEFDKVDDAGFREAVNYLVTYPPRKQVFIDQRVVWKESPPDGALRASAQALLMVRRVRNNLFHGGKYWIPDDERRDRNEKLVKAALAVLLACLPLHPRLRRTFGPLFEDAERLSRLAA